MDEKEQKSKHKYGINIIVLAPFLIFIVIPLFYLYFQHVTDRDQANNRHLFRTLGEASETINNRILQIDAARKYIYKQVKQDGKPKVLPNSYGSEICENELNKSGFKTIGRNFFYQSTKKTNESHDRPKSGCWKVPLKNLLPEPKTPYSQYLLVTEDNQVLANKGESQAFAITNTTQFAKQIAVEINRDWFKLASKIGGKTKDETTIEQDVKLPGYSYFFDIKVNPGEFRIYLYPFHFDPKINPIDEEEGTKIKNPTRLLLMGVTPKFALQEQDSKRSNLAEFIIIVIFLAFILSITRLLMTSEHQPIDGVWYYVTLSTSLLFFAVLSSAYFAWADRLVEQGHKAEQALELAIKTNRNFNGDLRGIFGEINKITFSDRDNTASHKTDDWAEPRCDKQEKVLSNDDNNTNRPPTQHKEQICLELKKHIKHEKDSSITSTLKISKNSCENTNTMNNLNKTKINENSKNSKNKLCVYFNKNFEFNEQSSTPKDSALEYSTDYVTYSSKTSENNLLSAFLIDESGIQKSPQIYNIEYQHKPKLLDLNHRDYFNKLKNKKGWEIPKAVNNVSDSKCPKQFYIQRLRNLTDRALGTTLSTYRWHDNKCMVLAGDIKLPSLSWQTKINPNEQADITLMVVDRLSGEVLFHQDSQYALNENIYAAGADTRLLQHQLQSGKDSCSEYMCGRPEKTLQPIAGNYQGKPGWFVTHRTSIDQWAIVTFFPDDTFENYFSNVFFINLYHFLIVAIVAIFIFWIFRLLQIRLDWRGLLKINTCIEARTMVLFSSLIVFSQIAGFWFDYALIKQFSLFGKLELKLPIFYLILVLFFGIYSCQYMIISYNQKCSVKILSKIFGADYRTTRILAFKLISILIATFALREYFRVNEGPNLPEDQLLAIFWIDAGLALIIFLYCLKNNQRQLNETKFYSHLLKSLYGRSIPEKDILMLYVLMLTLSLTIEYLLYSKSFLGPLISWAFSYSLLGLVLSWGLIYYLNNIGNQTEKYRAEINQEYLSFASTSNSTNTKVPWRAVVFFAIIGIALNLNLNRVGFAPGGSLNWYYNNLARATVNRERNEIEQFAHDYYPNSTVRSEKQPIEMLGELNPQLIPSDQKTLTTVNPEHLGSFSFYTRDTDLLQWLKLYFWEPKGNKYDVAKITRKNPMIFYWILTPIGAFLIVFGWLAFNRHIIYARLYGSQSMLLFFNRLYKKSFLHTPFLPNQNLRLILVRSPLRGLPLRALLQNLRSNGTANTNPFLEVLATNSELRQLLSQSETVPDVQLYCEKREDKYYLEIGELANSLDDNKNRDQLLNLLEKLKGLVQIGSIARLTLFCNASSMMMLLSANSLRSNEAQGITHLRIAVESRESKNSRMISSIEFAKWAHLLKHFTVDTGHLVDGKLRLLAHSPRNRGFDITQYVPGLSTRVQKDFDSLLEQQEVLKELLESHQKLIAMQIYCEKHDNGFLVEVSGMESCIENGQQRSHLLTILNELKRLQLYGKLNQLTVFCNSDKLNMLLNSGPLGDSSLTLRDDFPLNDQVQWAQYFSDFSVDTDDFLETLNPGLIAKETSAMPGLGFIQQALSTHYPDANFGPHQYRTNEYHWRNLFGTEKTACERRSIQFLQIKAGAYYRSVWNACNPSEKLALFYLAGGKRANPKNMKVLESLAARGLIRVEQGRLRIVNQSFADYVLNAEDINTIQQLIKQGESGLWQDNRVSVYILLGLALVLLSLWTGTTITMLLYSLVGIVALASNLISGIGFIRTRFLS